MASVKVDTYPHRGQRAESFRRPPLELVARRNRPVRKCGMSSTNIDWAALDHAFGPATDVPEYLAHAKDDPDAISELMGAILHQGTVYSATPVVVKLLAELALDSQFAGRLRGLEVLDGFGQAVYELTPMYDKHSGIAGAKFDDQCRAAYQESVAIVAPLLSDPDQWVQANAVCACRWLTEPDLVVAAGMEAAYAVPNWDPPEDRRPVEEFHQAAFTGLLLQGAATPAILAVGTEDDDETVRFLAACGKLAAGGRDEVTPGALAECWGPAFEAWEDRGYGLNPATIVAKLKDPLPVVSAMSQGPPEAAEGSLEVAEAMFRLGKIDKAGLVQLATRVGARPETELKQTAAEWLERAGETAAAARVLDSIVIPKGVKLSKKKLSTLVTLIHQGADPKRWLEPLLGHLNGTALATDYVSYRSGSVEGSLPNALAWAKPPALPPLVAAARRQLR
ncbi:MAG: hypothetical protein LBR19_04230, partial [Bifidobacteriaceae bacterium]|nr:hypothetical protein [Bifidobacteriaceae bacterium]